jgi:hypothetical protein
MHARELAGREASPTAGVIDRAPRFFFVFRSSGPVWLPEPCSKRLVGMFGSVVSDRFARSWRVWAPSA